jgi:hypothetical protein
MPDRIDVPLHRIAHARAGDKGDCLNVAVFCYDPSLYDLVVEQLTETRVAEIFAAHRPRRVRRYLLPKLAALNFVLDDVLAGGVNNSLRLDRHGKSLSYLLLSAAVCLPPEFIRSATQPAGGGSIHLPQKET